MSLTGTVMDPNVARPAVPAGEEMSPNSGGGGIFGFSAIPGAKGGPQGSPMGPMGGSLGGPQDSQGGPMDGSQFDPQGGSQFDLQGGSQDPAQCAPNDITCQVSIPPQTVDMGSSNSSPLDLRLPLDNLHPSSPIARIRHLCNPAQDNTLPQ